MPWSPPVARMREYVAALRAIWASWQDGTPLRFQGEHYRHTLMTPMFAPDAHAWGPPPVYLAAVGPGMTRLVGEVADGLLVHGFTTERYLRERTLPALEEGLTAAGRDRSAVAVTLPGLVVSGRDDDGVRRRGGRGEGDDRVLRQHPGLPPGAGAARLGGPRRRAARAVGRPPRGQVDGDARPGRRRGAGHLRDRRRAPRTSPPRCAGATTGWSTGSASTRPTPRPSTSGIRWSPPSADARRASPGRRVAAYWFWESLSVTRRPPSCPAPAPPPSAPRSSPRPSSASRPAPTAAGDRGSASRAATRTPAPATSSTSWCRSASGATSSVPSGATARTSRRSWRRARSTRTTSSRARRTWPPSPRPTWSSSTAPTTTTGPTTPSRPRTPNPRC